MAQHKINIDEQLLQGIFHKNEALSELVSAVINQILEAQVKEHLQAEPYERCEERQGHRNRYRERQITTRIGTLSLMVPRVRDGSFSPELFARYQRSEQAFVLALMEMVINGISTRKVTKVVEELCGSSISKSTVSALCQKLDPVVSDWKNRSLKESIYPFVIVDALVTRVRIEKRVRQQSLLVATGISSEGRREILGFSIGDKESEASWSAFFRSLKDRGLSGVDLVVSDDHQGLVNAAHSVFQGSSWQRCQMHFKRNILDSCPKSVQTELSARLRLLFEAPDMQTARLLLARILEDFASKAPKSTDCLERGFEDAMAVMALPEFYRKRLRGTNSQDRLNKEIRRRERVIGIFPNITSAERLLGAILMEQDGAWSSGVHYFIMDEYWSSKKELQTSMVTLHKEAA
jgi:transposase-like protein